MQQGLLGFYVFSILANGRGPELARRNDQGNGNYFRPLGFQKRIYRIYGLGSGRTTEHTLGP